MPVKSSRVSLKDFSREIMTDFDDLLDEEPMGVTMSSLTSYYGESMPRVARALEILIGDGKIERRARASNTAYFIPTGYDTPRAHPELTSLQYTLLRHLQTLCKVTINHQVHCNYSRLSETLHYSVGGTKAALNRLIDMEYLRLINSYDVNDRQMVVEVIVLDGDTDERDNTTGNT